VASEEQSKVEVSPAGKSPPEIERVAAAIAVRPEQGTGGSLWVKRNVGRLVGLIAVTAFAVAVAVTVSAGGRGERDRVEDPVDPQAAPAAPVAVVRVEEESIEIIDSYPGLIEPRERFVLGFEIGGRVVEFGRNEQGQDLDEGDRVKPGQLLARLDDRTWQYQLSEAQAQARQAQAQLAEAKAHLEDAQSDLRRAEQLRRAGGHAITESEYQDLVTKLAVAQAQAATAEAQVALAEARVQAAAKALEDARLVSPIEGVISARLVNPGESVSPHQTVFEILDVEEVLLVVGVPEANIGPIQPGRRVRVELLARDQFVFKVEILVPNPAGELKPGLIARANIVVSQLKGFRIPLSAVLFREEATYFFAVDSQGRAHRVDLDEWIEQEHDVIVKQLPAEYRTIVVRGQHRLVEGRKVRIVNLDGVSLEQEQERDLLLRGAAAKLSS